MPDVTPKPLRSKGNAIINLMGAVGGIIYLGVAAVMYPTAKVTEVLASKSNLPGSIGLSLSLSLDEEDQKSYLAKLNELDNVLFVLAEE